MTSSKPDFKRQESWRYKRVAENWRRPRGVTSKMRKEESGFPSKVKVGYGTDAQTRGLHPRGLAERLVYRVTDLESIDPAIHIVRIFHGVGERKRLTIIAKAKERNFHVANPGKEESRPVPEASEKPGLAIDATESSAGDSEGEVEAAKVNEESSPEKEDSE